MTLLHDLVLVKPTKETQLANGIILPEQAQKKNKGEVMLIGRKVKHLKVGDTVMYDQNAGTAINYEKQSMLLLSESKHIEAVVV